MSSAPPEARTLTIANGASLRVLVPSDATAEPESALPTIDVSNLPGATVPVRAGFRDAHAMVRVVCATAPSRGWAPGVEQIVMGRASQIARAAIGGDVTRFDATDTKAMGAQFEQRFEANVLRGGEPMRAVGKHVIGFAGASRDAIVCSVVCTEAERKSACGAIVDGATTEGAWVSAPPASVVVRAILIAADQPRIAGSLALLTTMVVAALVIARRPRPRAL